MRLTLFIAVCFIMLFSNCGIIDTDDETPKVFKPNSDMWVGAYFGAWNHFAPPGGNWGHLPTDEIDWDAFTHLFYFSLFANKDYYEEERYQWDDKAHAAYLSIEGETPLENRFISYDDEQSIRSKIEYVREKGIGGTIIWEISGAHFKDEPAGKKDPLLQTVKQEVWRK